MKAQHRIYIFDLNGKILEEHESAGAYARKEGITVSSVYNHIYRASCFRGCMYISRDKNFSNVKSIKIPLNDKKYYIFKKDNEKMKLCRVSPSKAACIKFIYSMTGRFIEDIRYYIDNNNGLIDNQYAIYTFNKYPLSEEQKKYEIEKIKCAE